MDRALRIIGIVGLAYLAWNFIYNRVYANIEYGFTRLRIRKLHPTAIEVEVIQPITNNNPVSFPIDSLRADILYGNTVLGNFALREPIILQAGEKQNMVFTSMLDFSGLATTVTDVIATGEWLRALRAKGIAVSKGVVIPWEHTISVG